MKKIRKILIFLIATSLFLLLSGNAPALAQSASADTTPPSDVENLKAAAGNAEVRLSWDPASDNVRVTGYKVYSGLHSVQKAGETYDLPVLSAGDVINFTVKNLTNDATYYFSVTAVDAVGNESANFAIEASATPKSTLTLTGAADDGKAPQVKQVKAQDVITVLVTFSEAVKLPEEHPSSAFTIVKTADRAALAVQNAVMDARDTTGATVILTTAPQEKDAEYLLTAGFEVQDASGNPVVSGTSDTGSFRGSGKNAKPVLPPPPVPPPPAAAPPPPPAKNSGGANALRGASIEDLTPPEDAMKLTARVTGPGKNIVELRWQLSKNSAGDLTDQLLARSDDRYGRNFSSSSSLGTSTSSADIGDLAPGNWYTFKISAKDAHGNESRGVRTSIYVPKMNEALPETGPGLGAAVLASLLMGWWSRTKKTSLRGA